jgi:hypothetical protein
MSDPRFPPGEPTPPYPHGALNPHPPSPDPPEPTDPGAAGIIAPLLIGCAVAVLLGVYGSLHEPTGFSVNVAGFSSGGYAKAWLATVAVVLGVVQLATARLMYGATPVASAPWLSGLHRWSGRAAVVITVPVVIHCLFALGFQTYDPRVVVHSLLGCAFYGAFVAKMLSLVRRGLPGWMVPVLGGTLFTVLVGLWLTSAVWLFGGQGVHF